MPLFKGLSSKSTPKKAIDYITRGDKAAYVSVRNLFEDEDYAEQFADTMRRFGKGKKFDERKYYHFKLSCARKDNVNPNQAHLYAQKLAQRNNSQQTDLAMRNGNEGRQKVLPRKQGH